MVLRTIEMREIGFTIPKDKRKAIIKKILDTYKNEFEIIEDEKMVWIKGDLHNRFKRRKILFILSGGRIGKNQFENSYPNKG